jgi:uncharacterized protein YrrD
VDIAINADVYCVDGLCGRSICIILDPASKQVTHVGVQENGLCPHAWLVPTEYIKDSTPNRIQLDLSKKEIKNEMSPFIKTEFLESDLPYILYMTNMTWPHLIANLEMKTMEHENIPLDELAVHSGAVVEARDGVIGRLEDLVVNPDDKRVTQILIRTGRWYGHSRLAIPVSAIDHFEDDTIYLSLSKSETEAVPTQSQAAMSKDAVGPRG